MNASLLGFVLSFTGKPQKAIEAVERAMRLSPTYPTFNLYILGRAYRLVGRTEDAIAAFRAAIAREPGAIMPHAYLAALLGILGRDSEAAAAAAELRRIDPNFTVAQWALALPYRDPADREAELDGLRKAGLDIPDEAAVAE